MAFGATSVLDNFNRSNTGPPMSADWTDVVGSMKVLSNQAIGAADGDNVSCWDTATFGPECEAYYTFTGDLTWGGQFGICARVTTLVSSTYDGYGIKIYDAIAPDVDEWYICKITNGTWSDIGAAMNQNMATGDSIGIEVTGTTTTTIKAYYKSGAGSWTLIGSRTDSTSPYTSAGYVGIWSPDQYMTEDNFGGGTLTTATAVPVFMHHLRQQEIS